MPGNQVKDWGQYHALRKENYSKESAAKIVNASSNKTPHPRVDQIPKSNGPQGGKMSIQPVPNGRGGGPNGPQNSNKQKIAAGMRMRNEPISKAKAKHAAVARLRSKYSGL